MVNKTLTSFDPNRVRTYSVGFDRLFDQLIGENFPAQSNFPPYNIVKTDEDSYQIELALAGFGKDDIEIEVKENTLTVRSAESGVDDIEDIDVVDSKEYLHRGISMKKFTRSFTLADDVIVGSANLDNGMLVIDLTRIVPEEKKPRLIEIK
jgi:molecular chaperone IbpA